MTKTRTRSTTTDALERSVQDLARRIAEAGASERTRVFHMSWWSERMLDWALAHPDFKTQLFRFVDVFPACRDADDVVRHLEEYFEGVDAPAPFTIGLEAAERVPLGSRITATVARRNILRMARQFIAGSTPGEAMPALRTLWRLGEAATVDLLGEKTVTLAEADRYAARVRELLDAFHAEASTWPDDPHLERDPWGGVPRVNVSVKPTALAPLYAPLTAAQGLEQALERLRPICARAEEIGATVHLDMEHYDVKDLTLQLVRALPEDMSLGVVVQAYLRDSYDDLVALCDRPRKTPLQVRLVKGAYWDVETIVARANGWDVPVFEQKAETDLNYERCARLLLERAGHVRPLFGSHNIRSIAFVMAYARQLGLHESAFELQLLYGMAEPVHAALRRFGMRVRTYAPVGDLVPGMAYLVRRLLENTSNESFIRHRFAEGKALDELVRAPAVSSKQLALEDGFGPNRLDLGRGLRPPHPPKASPHPPKASPHPPKAPVRDFATDGFLNEPHSEFRRPEARTWRPTAGDAFDAPVIIDGQRIATREQIVSVDPGDFTRAICRSGRAGAPEADRAIDVAAKAFPKWRAAPWKDRAAVLRRAAAIMRRRRRELAALEIFEAGKPWAEADADVAEAIDFCEYYATQAERIGSGVPLLQAPGEVNQYRYQPRGIGLVIAPWNFPLAIPCGMVVAALVCGNCVLFKPAEQTPGVALRLCEILLEAGVPHGALAFLPGVGEEIGAYLVEHPDVAFVTFTGSKAVGLHIIERAAVHAKAQRHVKRVVAEMGGKNAIVVDTDADLDIAVPAIVHSAFTYAGQKCSAASRVIGVGPIFDELVGRIAGAAALARVGHPRDMSIGVGPVIDEDAWKRVRTFQELAASEGTVVFQRSDVPEGGWYVGPTVMTTPNPDARCFTEEIFGPLLAVLPAADFDEALALAASTEYALTGGVFSRSPSRIRRAPDELRAGNVYINRAITGALVGRQPFGGYGLSGVGSKAGGPDYLLQFVEPRVITENTIRQGFAPPD